MNKDNFGNWVFKYRGQIPLVFLWLAFLFSYFFRYQLVDNKNINLLTGIAGLCMIFAAIMRAYTIGFAAQHSSGRNRSEQVAENLNVRGAYSMVQNPLYFANALLWFATSIFSNQWVFVVGVLTLISFLFPIMVLHERDFLRNKFGEEFHRWDKVTPIFIPNPWLFKAPKITFQWTRLLATEYPTWVSICVGILAVHWFGMYLSTGKISMATEHYLLVLCAIMLGFAGRFFKYIVVRRWLKKSI